MLTLIKLPSRKLIVTICTRSGFKQRFSCDEIKITKNADNSLSGIMLRGGRLPFYTRLDAVDMITFRRAILRWSFS